MVIDHTEDEFIEQYAMDSDPFLASKVRECLQMKRETDPEADSVCGVCEVRLIVLMRDRQYADVQFILNEMIRPVN